eukprot:CAMPEP_0118981754 /NCGR_PEP_ID=MMETSP1173-20130426/31230_1 /TAXON_ID=1034831 /ORGANISM="Rhizochromulina marina cf, Strain CCMP1243" /LENGTH=412 /DNA_ID=CAMNT_0006932199 /DNA_START=13 /DNA_END=1247 /DNA_ORIENTATION=-
MTGWLQPLVMDAIRLSSLEASSSLPPPEPQLEALGVHDGDDWVSYGPVASGSGSHSAHPLPSMLPMLCNAVGMASVGLLTGISESSRSRVGQPCVSRVTQGTALQSLLRLAAVDFISGGLVVLGQLHVPSSLFVVLYASCTIWTAVIAQVWLKQRLSLARWCAIAAIALGLCGDALTAEIGTPQNGSRAGVLLVLAGAFLHSYTICLAERTIRLLPTVSSIEACSFMGAIEASILAFYEITHVLLDAPMPFPPSNVLVLYPLLTFFQAVHAASFFYILGNFGSVTTGVLKGLQMVVVFLASDVLFCSADESDCVTASKFACVVLVVLGLLTYSWADPQRRGVTSAGDGSDVSASSATVMMAKASIETEKRGHSSGTSSWEHVSERCHGSDERGCGEVSGRTARGGGVLGGGG